MSDNSKQAGWGGGGVRGSGGEEERGTKVPISLHYLAQGGGLGSLPLAANYWKSE